jgi:hypothetical protein
MSDYKNKDLTTENTELPGEEGICNKNSAKLQDAQRAPVLRGFLLVFLLMCASGASGADRWYISNAAGMALEPAFSRLALREKYALLVTEIPPGDLPTNLREYYDRLYQESRLPVPQETETGVENAADAPFSLRLEKRILYKDREASRLQWLFLDGENLARLAAAFAVDPDEYPPPEIPADEANVENGVPEDGGTDGDEAAEDAGDVGDGEAGAEAGENETEEDGGNGEAGENDEDGGGEAEEEKPAVDYSGYIEVYNGEGFIVEEHLFSSDSSGRTVNYFYNGRRLVRAVTKTFPPADGTAENRAEDYCTDNYRYSRSSSLRGVERIYHSAAEAETKTEPGAEPVRLRFPHVVLGAAKNAQFVSPAVSFSNEFFMDILVDSGSRVLYTTDERGRVLTETRRNEDGEVLGELRNTWSGDRLVSIHWKAGDDERVTEFEYNDDGDRILERNINRGVLEREVSIEKGEEGDGDRETELLYLDGKPVLKAVWKNGRKVSEERLRPNGDLQSQPALDGAGF